MTYLDQLLDSFNGIVLAKKGGLTVFEAENQCYGVLLLARHQMIEAGVEAWLIGPYPKNQDMDELLEIPHRNYYRSMHDNSPGGQVSNVEQELVGGPARSLMLEVPESDHGFGYAHPAWQMNSGDIVCKF